MVRIWKGIEKEGIGKESEIMTLFVSSTVAMPSSKMIAILEENKDIKAVYFGAGRVRFNGVDGWTDLCAYCKDNGIKIVMEIPAYIYLNNFVNHYPGCSVYIVAEYNCVPCDADVYFKTDDLEVTKIYTLQKTVDITSVVEDRYKDDVVLYEEVI